MPHVVAKTFTAMTTLIGETAAPPPPGSKVKVVLSFTRKSGWKSEVKSKVSRSGGVPLLTLDTLFSSRCGDADCFQTRRRPPDKNGFYSAPDRFYSALAAKTGEKLCMARTCGRLGSNRKIPSELI